MTVEDVLGKLAGVTATETGWAAVCPACKGLGALQVGQGDNGRVLLDCHEGCGFGEIIGAVGISYDEMGGDGVEDVRMTTGGKRRKVKKPLDIVKRWDYQLPGGEIVYQVCVCADGTSRLRVPDPEKGVNQWKWGRSRWGVPAVPFRLPRVIAAVRDGVTVWVVPTEKDVEAMESLGCVATCSLDDHDKKLGAGEWQEDFCRWFSGAMKTTVIVARKDAPPKPHDVAAALKAYQGQRRAERIRIFMEAAGVRVKVLALPDRGDVRIETPADWVNAGGTKDELFVAVKASAPWACPDALGKLSEEQLGAAEGQVRPPLEKGGAASSPLSPLASASEFSAASPTPLSGVNSKNVRGVSGKNDAAGVEGGDEDGGQTSVEWLRGQEIAIYRAEGKTPFEKRVLLSGLVVSWLKLRGKFFYHEDYRDHATSMYFDGEDKVLQSICSDYFKSWLANVTGVNRTSRDFSYFEAAVEDEAVSGVTTGIYPEMYWARRGERIYISNGDGAMARVSAEGVELVDNGTDSVLFERGKTLVPWKTSDAPEDPFEACSVFASMACSAVYGRMLVKLWTIAMMGNMPCKPPLVFAGTVGSGKTKCATSIFELLGMIPRVSALNDMAGVKDFWTSADAGGLICFDNADTRIKWLPDALATIATNGTYEKKKNYTDSEVFVQYARCWCIVTSSNPSFASDAGLADRLIVVTLDRVTRDTAESRLSREIAEHRDAGMTWIAGVLSRALADKEPVPGGLNRRHPDWADMAYRIGRALGDEKSARDAITCAEAYKSLFSLQNDALGVMLLAAITEDFEGTTTELVELLKRKNDGFKEETWTATRVGKIMEKMRPHLEAVFHMTRVNHSGKGFYRFTAPKEQPPQSEVLKAVFEEGTNKSINTATFTDLTLTTPNIVRGCGSDLDDLEEL